MQIESKIRERQKDFNFIPIFEWLKRRTENSDDKNNRKWIDRRTKISFQMLTISKSHKKFNEEKNIVLNILKIVLK